MKKVVVIGCPGSGKSWFSRELHKMTALPLFHLDMMYWNEDKTIVAKSLFLERLSSAMQGEKWIIDGNYSSTMEMRIAACDTVFFLDYSLEQCLDGIRERRGKRRDDIPWIETEDDLEFTEFIKSFGDKQRPRILELFGKYPDKRIVIFKTREEAKRFLKE